MQDFDWRTFRKADLAGRRRQLATALAASPDTPSSLDSAGLDFAGPSPDSLALADALVENAIGVMPVPLGLAGGFLIDGTTCQLPMATEEPSVVAAASFAAAIIARHGGFTTWTGDPVMTAQIFIEFPPRTTEQPLQALAGAESSIKSALEPQLASMARRGGGYRGMDLAWLDLDAADPACLVPHQRILRLQVHIDTRDAMGANLLNTAAESLRPLVESLSGGRVLMAILSNAAAGRLGSARCRLPLAELGRGRYRGRELGERIALATRVADSDPGRAVTHNKGIMNGISALALATANDTRAIEAAAHAWAARGGTYRSLSAWAIEGEDLVGSLELPLPFAVTGGGTACHPVARMALRLAGADSAVQLSRLAAALGLAQNFAALQALCGDGIQAGHMPLHERRAAWIQGRFKP